MGKHSRKVVVATFKLTIKSERFLELIKNLFCAVAYTVGTRYAPLMHLDIDIVENAKTSDFFDPNKLEFDIQVHDRIHD